MDTLSIHLVNNQCLSNEEKYYLESKKDLNNNSAEKDKTAKYALITFDESPEASITLSKASDIEVIEFTQSILPYALSIVVIIGVGTMLGYYLSGSINEDLHNVDPMVAEITQRWQELQEMRPRYPAGI